MKFMVMLSIERIEDEDSNLSGIDDGQTNGINFFQFVCPSRTPFQGERARACGAVVGMDDGQTNGINFITFFCPSITDPG